MEPPSFSVRVRNLVPASSVSLQSATSGCQSLIAQKPPATPQTFGGSAGALIFFLTSSAYAKLVVRTIAASAAKPNFTLRMRLLHLQIYGLFWQSGGDHSMLDCRA